MNLNFLEYGFFHASFYCILCNKFKFEEMKYDITINLVEGEGCLLSYVAFIA